MALLAMRSLRFPEIPTRAYPELSRAMVVTSSEVTGSHTVLSTSDISLKRPFEWIIQNVIPPWGRVQSKLQSRGAPLGSGHK